MNESAVFSRHEYSEYSGYEFDYRADFAQFLEEAKRSERQGTFNTASLDAAGKNRKSWKNSLFSWLNKTSEKGKSTKKQVNGSSLSKPRWGHVSGPVQESIGDNVTAGRGQRPASGPLTGLFSTRRRAQECEVPYMCLGQLNSPHKLHSYGPIYLVT